MIISFIQSMRAVVPKNRITSCAKLGEASSGDVTRVWGDPDVTLLVAFPAPEWMIARTDCRTCVGSIMSR